MEDLRDLTIKELKAKCKELGLSGYSRMKEDELIALIESVESDSEETTETEEVKETTETVKFKKLIKGAYGFNGQEFRGNFELSGDEAKHPKIKRAIELGILEIVK